MEQAAGWDGEPGGLVTALVELGFLEKRRNRILVHNWLQWSGTYAAEKAADRERKKRKAGEAGTSSTARPPQDIHRNSAGASPSPSPSPSPSALEEDDHRQEGFSAHGDAPDGAQRPFWDNGDWSMAMREMMTTREAGVFDNEVEREAARIKAMPMAEQGAEEVRTRRAIEARFTRHRGGGDD